MVMVGLLEMPVFVPYVGWAIGSVGMGIVFPTIPLAVMAEVAGAFGVGIVAAVLLALVARRLPDARAA
jgi:hypothetical protein